MSEALVSLRRSQGWPVPLGPVPHGELNALLKRLTSIRSLGFLSDVVHGKKRAGRDLSLELEELFPACKAGAWKTPFEKDDANYETPAAE